MSKSSNGSKKPQEGAKDMRIEEYRQAIRYDIPLTTLNWQIASIFIAGILAALGLTISKDTNPFNLASSVA